MRDRDPSDPNDDDFPMGCLNGLILTALILAMVMALVIGWSELR